MGAGETRGGRAATGSDCGSCAGVGETRGGRMGAGEALGDRACARESRRDWVAHRELWGC